MLVYQRQEQYNGPRSKSTDFKTCPPVGQLIYEVTTMLTRERATELNNTMVTEEHLLHTAEPLREAGVDEEDIRAILAHGFEICTDVKPETNLEKSLFTVDELTGIVQACARMRPHGITDLEVKSFMKKFKDKRFAAKCDRDTILKGCEMLGMDVKDVAAIVIEGMKEHAAELGLQGSEE